MFISHKPQFVYVAFTKSGSSSMYALLDQHFKGEKRNRTHRRIPDEYKHYPSFCVVRNPYSRLVSWWWSICKAEGDRYGHKKELADRGLTTSFTDFLKLWATKNGIAQAPIVNLNQFDYILKLENITNDLNTLPFFASKVEFPQRNKRNHPHWTDIITAESGKFINDTYREDFELLGYEMLDFGDET